MSLALADILSVAQDEAEGGIMRQGNDTPLPGNEFDLDDFGLEFSAYSPPGPEEGGRMTWGILHDVTTGLSEYLVDQTRDREAFFKVFDGKLKFVGYGHLVKLKHRVDDVRAGVDVL